MNELKAMCNILLIEIRLIQGLLLGEFNNTVLASHFHIIKGHVSGFHLLGKTEIVFFVKKGWAKSCNLVNGRTH